MTETKARTKARTKEGEDEGEGEADGELELDAEVEAEVEAVVDSEVTLVEVELVKLLVSVAVVEVGFEVVVCDWVRVLGGEKLLEDKGTGGEITINPGDGIFVTG